MTQRVLIFLLLLSLASLAACVEMELPSNEEVEKLFSSDPHTAELHKPHPEGIPALDASELGGWRDLCDQCHVGPHYSSYSNLTWGHLDTCITPSGCLECHGNNLHRLDVRGSKSVCMECHYESGRILGCNDCHVADWYENHSPEGHSLDTHGSWAMEDSAHCASCHGTGRWCKACHGVEMPHPADILVTHPMLVRGEPELCSNCHGATPCETCHVERNIFSE